MIGPLEPQLSPGGYSKAFAALQEAITAGDIYQANLTFPLSGSWRGDPLALYAAIRPFASAGYGGIVFDGMQLAAELFARTVLRAERRRSNGQADERHAASRTRCG